MCNLPNLDAAMGGGALVHVGDRDGADAVVAIDGNRGCKSGRAMWPMSNAQTLTFGAPMVVGIALPLLLVRSIAKQTVQ